MKKQQGRKKQGNIYDENTPGIGYCRNTGNPFYFDPEDYDKIKDYTWSDRWKDGYHELRAWDSNLQQMIWMHWLITGKECDHIDRDPMNNRKSNLREATQSQQCQNRNKTRRNNSGIVGVCYSKRQDAWEAYISIDKKQIHLGYFTNKENAIRIRLEAELEYYGDFAPQRHLFEKYGITEQIIEREYILKCKNRTRIKPIVQISLNDEYIKKYNTITLASKENNINYACIWECCNYKQKTAGGYKWMYESDWLQLQTQQNDYEGTVS